MKKTNLIIIFALIVLVLLVLLTSLVSKWKEKNNPSIVPTGIAFPTTIVTNPSPQPVKKITILSVSPSDEKKDVSVNSAIRIQFDQAVSKNEITFSIAPATNVLTRIEKNTLIVTTKQPWKPGVYYTYTVKFSNPSNFPRSFSFRTVGPTSKYKPDTYPVGAADSTDDFVRTNHPDMYVRNIVPYSNDFFSIVGPSEITLTGPITFTVTKKTASQDEAQIKVQEWLKSMGLTSSQIQSLQISYK